MQLRVSLLKKFIIFSLPAFFIIWLALSFLVTYEIEQYTLKRVQTELASQIKDQTTEHLPKSIFEKNSYINNKKQLDDFYKKLQRLGIERIKIYDRSGFVIYSDETSIIGKSFNNKDLDEALEGHDEAEIEEAGSKDENRTEGELKKFIEAYLPISYEGDTTPSGVVEVYYPLEPVYNSLNPFLRNIWLTSSGLLGLLFLSLYLIFRAASKTIIEKNRELEDKTTELKLSKDQDEAILESIDEGLLMVNRGGQILTFNSKAETLTGYKNEEIVFRHYKGALDFRDKDGKKVAEDYLKNALAEGTVTRKTSRDNIFLKVADEQLAVSLICAPIFDNGLEKIVGAVLTLNDATNDKELDRVKDEFVYVIAHELNNPIFSVNGYLSMVLEGTFGKIPSKLKEPLSAALGSGQQLASLVTDLLEVIRSETGQMKFELESIDLIETTKEVAKNLSMKAKEKQTVIKMDDQDLDNVKSNYLKLKEILTNLIDNAIKYSPEKSEVKISFEEKDGLITTNVTDNGYGMSKEESNKLFQRFYRIQNDQTRGITGTGLGLFIVKQLVEKMEGKIWLTSEPGKGTTFSFSLKIDKVKRNRK